MFIDHVSMLTTKDNPFDPFTQFDDWFSYDEQHGYHTCAYLARIAKTSNGLSTTENYQEIERAIDEIVQFNLLGNYKKVSRPITIKA